MKQIRIFLILLAIFYGCNPEPRQISAPSGLITELLRAPDQAVITSPNPAFGWIFPQEGVSQTACRILVASSPELLTQDKGDLWDSGKMQTGKSIHVVYGGSKLQPHSSYWWKVKVWGEDRSESPFSEPQKFNTGEFDRPEGHWPGQSNWVETEPGKWVAEDRQMATFRRIAPAAFEKTGTNSWFADFGKAAFATLEFSATAGNEGETLELFLGERKNPDKTVHKNPGISNIGFFTYALRLKKGTHSYQVEIPRHDARYPHSQKLAPFYPEVLPFRYVEMNGSERVTVDSLAQLALFYYFDDEASAFSSTNTNLNLVWDLCRYTLKATPFLGVYCDGNRERMPYEADAYIQQLGHYSVDREYSAARYTTTFLLSHASWPTEWQMHAVMMAREHYMYTGDTRLLEMVYDDLKKKTLIDLAREDGLISTRTGKVTPEFFESLHLNRDMQDIVDWPAGTPAGQKQANNAGPAPEGERDGYVFTDFNTVVNAFHFHALKCMAEIAGAIGNTEDQEFFASRADRVRQSILKLMFDEQRGIFVDGIGTDHASLHANMFPLAFNLVPEDKIKPVAEYIKTRGMACSVYGAQYLLEALYNAGEAEYALQLMTSEGKRSWMNMLKVGSTMTTEAWDEYYKPNLTWNHAWGAAPANIIPRRLMGIQPVEPGFESFVVNPQPFGLAETDLKIPTIRGPIECALSAGDDKWQMELSVPGNSLALVLFPSEFPELLVNGEKVQADSQVHYLDLTRNMIRLKGGSYRITASK
jgi:alpha-L-rhamnosidase